MSFSFSRCAGCDLLGNSNFWLVRRVASRPRVMVQPDTPDRKSEDYGRLSAVIRPARDGTASDVALFRKAEIDGLAYEDASRAGALQISGSFVGPRLGPATIPPEPGGPIIGDCWPPAATMAMAPAHWLFREVREIDIAGGELTKPFVDPRRRRFDL